MHIVFNVLEMSEKRTPVSIYLSPRASVILRNYSRGSGYGSISRTVEEIILAFDGVYKNMSQIHKLITIAPSDPKKQQEKAAMALVAMISLLHALSNIVSRLSPEQIQ